MNPVNPDNGLLQAILHQLRLHAVAKPKLSGQSAEKASKVEMAGVANAKSLVITPTTSCIGISVQIVAIAHLFSSVAAFVPDTSMEIPHKTIEHADNTMVNAMQQRDAIILFRNVNIIFSEKVLVPNLG